MMRFSASSVTHGINQSNVQLLVRNVLIGREVRIRLSIGSQEEKVRRKESL